MQVQPVSSDWAEGDTLPRAMSISNAVLSETGYGVATTSSIAQKSSSDSLARALDLIRRGSHPLDMYPTPHLLAHLRPRLDRVMAICWQHQSPRLCHQISAADSPGLKPHLSLDVLLTSLALLPICELQAWAGNGGRALSLSQKTLHI